MTLVPAVLVLIVGSELIRTSIDRWFNAPMDEILSSANQIAGDYYHERQMRRERPRGAHRARRWRRSISTNADVRPIRDLLAPDVTLQRVQMVEVYRVVPRRRVARAARAGGRRRRAGAAAGLQPRGGRSAGGAGARRLARHAIDRDARARPAICCTRRRVIRDRDGRGDRRRRGDRLPDRRSGGAVAPHDAGVRELQPAARAASGRSPASTCRSS